MCIHGRMERIAFWLFSGSVCYHCVVSLGKIIQWLNRPRQQHSIFTGDLDSTQHRYSLYLHLSMFYKFCWLNQKEDCSLGTIQNKVYWLYITLHYVLNNSKSTSRKLFPALMGSRHLYLQFLSVDELIHCSSPRCRRCFRHPEVQQVKSRWDPIRPTALSQAAESRCNYTVRVCSSSSQR